MVTGRPTAKLASGLYEFLGEDLHLVEPTSLFMEGGMRAAHLQVVAMIPEYDRLTQRVHLSLAQGGCKINDTSNITPMTPEHLAV